MTGRKPEEVDKSAQNADESPSVAWVEAFIVEAFIVEAFKVGALLFEELVVEALLSETWVMGSSALEESTLFAEERAADNLSKAEKHLSS